MTTILAYVPDLMFATRIIESAKRLGLSLESLEMGEDPTAAIERVSPKLVVVALDALNWLTVVRAAKQAGARVLAFGPHSDAATLQAARAAGADQVVARSRMASELPDLLASMANDR